MDDDSYTIDLEYKVAVRGGPYLADEYNTQLVDAMDALAPEVLLSILGDRRLGTLRRRRRLESVMLPTSVEATQEGMFLLSFSLKGNKLLHEL